TSSRSRPRSSSEPPSVRSADSVRFDADSDLPDLAPLRLGPLRGRRRRAAFVRSRRTTPPALDSAGPDEPLWNAAVGVPPGVPPADPTKGQRPCDRRRSRGGERSVHAGPRYVRRSSGLAVVVFWNAGGDGIESRIRPDLPRRREA